MKERPILFSGAMVRAILEGRKTMTRRVVKLSPGWMVHGTINGGEKGVIISRGHGRLADGSRQIPCPYEIGMRLWVRETWRPDRLVGRTVEKGPFYRASEPESENFSTLWTPSIHMPRWASRITLEIVNVRAEKLFDISEEDAKAEGYERREHFLDGEWAKEKSETLGDPWVWVVEFKRVTL